MSFRNTTEYIRALHNAYHPFAMISAKLIDDERLGVIEKGIMLSLLGQSDKYIVNMNYEQKRSGLGYIVFNKAVGNLMKLGYIKREKQVSGYRYVIIEDPNF